MPVGAAIAGSAVIGAAATSSASRNTTRAAESTAETNNALQREVYNRNTANMQPYMEGGGRSFAAWQDFMGLTPRPQANQPQAQQSYPTGQPGGSATYGGTGGSAYGDVGVMDMAMASDDGNMPMRPNALYSPALGGAQVQPQQPGAPLANTGQPGAPANALSGYDQFKASTGYETGLAEGFRGLNSRLASQGRLFSGDAGREAIRYGQNYADTFSTNYLDRLMQGTQIGAGATNALAGVGTNYANATGANNNNALAATAAGNAANAGAITGLAGNVGSAAAYYYGNRPSPTASSYGGGNASTGYGRPIFWG